MRVAEQALQVAMTELAQAEQRLPEVRLKAGASRRRRPAWNVAADAQEQAAGDTLELVYQQIAQTPAHTKAGLAIKLQLVTVLYGETLGDAGDDTDMVSRLLQSLIADTAGSVAEIVRHDT